MKYHGQNLIGKGGRLTPVAARRFDLVVKSQRFKPGLDLSGNRIDVFRTAEIDFESS